MGLFHLKRVSLVTWNQGVGKRQKEGNGDELASIIIQKFSCYLPAFSLSIRTRIETTCFLLSMRVTLKHVHL
jgi:hypothetical protein